MFWGGWEMAFSLIIIFLLWPFRRLGWFLSHFLYRTNTVLCLILLTFWGGGMGFMVGTLDWNFKPNLILKIIFGFFGGLYLSAPNFGLLNEATVPWDAQGRHKLIAHYPQVVFAIVALLMFYLNYSYPRPA
jgi:hypothetical protein